MASLWATEADRERLEGADSACFLVGGYDGSGNYGDVLQLAGAVETAEKLPGGALVVAVVEHETLGHHRELTRRYEGIFGKAAFAFFSDRDSRPDDDLAPMAGPGGLPAGTVMQLYGGGYFNRWWGARKAAHVAAVEALGGRPLPLVASGLQIEEAAVAPGGSARGLLARASWIGVRDASSLGFVRRHLPSTPVQLAGDDALPRLVRDPGGSAQLVNLHVNDGSWISDEPEALRSGIVAVLRELADSSDEPLLVQPVIAYEDPRVSESNVLTRVLDPCRGDLEAANVELLAPLDVLDDAVRSGLGAFRRARLTIGCSYHVTLTSLLAGIPAMLLAQNEYYDQKAAGLRDLFGLDPGLVGVAVERADAGEALDALRDGEARTDLVVRLQDRSRRLVDRFEQSRVGLSAALRAGIRQSALELALDVDRSRAEAADHELAAVHATRGWRLLNRLRAVRDTLRSGARAPTPPQPPPQPPKTDLPLEIGFELTRLTDLVEEAKGRGDYALEVARDMSLPTRMLAFMSWLELRPPVSGPTISIVLATRDRPQLLARAIPSVQAQRYEHWQLVVVDDGTDSGTRAVVDAVDDERVTLHQGPRSGLGAARNVGLNAAVGEIVCYLDDDNMMHPRWLQAVAEVFATREDVDVAYGISLAEHRIPDDLGEHGWWPSFWQLPWSRETALEENVTDAGSLAHRRSLDDARFDEGLRTGEDWDLLLRLTRDRDALAIPAISHAYSMDGPDRMSRHPGHRSGLGEIRRRHRDAR